jgi:hypothetical protein
LIVGLAWGRGPILRQIYRFLVVDEGVEAAAFAFVGDGDGGTLDKAAELLRQGKVQRLILIGDTCHRVVRLHIVPDPIDSLRSRFALRGIPASAIGVIPGSGGTFRENVRDVSRFLGEADRPLAVYVAPETRSRYARYVTDVVLDKAAASSLRIVAAPQRKFNSGNWWNSAAGWRGVFDSYFRLGFVWANGSAGLENRRWEPADFERTLP